MALTRTDAALPIEGTIPESPPTSCLKRATSILCTSIRARISPTLGFLLQRTILRWSTTSSVRGWCCLDVANSVVYFFYDVR
jgi:hypothetical protein